MNTPSPCDKCEHLYYDCMQKDNPSDSAECKLGLSLGNKKCPKFKKDCFSTKENIEFDSPT